MTAAVALILICGFGSLLVLVELALPNPRRDARRRNHAHRLTEERWWKL